jgi:hypothetical protein
MSVIKMPKGGIQNPNGQLTTAGYRLLGDIAERVSDEPATSAEQFLASGPGLVKAEAIWGTMDPAESTGGGDWQPDLGERLHFKRTLSGPTTILFPANVPPDAEPYFSVWVIQNSVGGWAVDYGPGFLGQAPVILTAANDRTLLGFNIFSASEFTGWAVKGIQA